MAVPATKNPIDSQFFYESLSQITPEAVVIHSGGKILYINPYASKLVGMNADDLLGKDVTVFLHPESLKIAKARIKKMLKTNKEVAWQEEKFVRLDGSTVIGEVKSIPFKYKRKQAILTIIHDITERKSIEERTKILTNLNQVFALSVSQKITLENIIKKLVPSMADYCRIALVDENKKLRIVATDHLSPEKVTLSMELFDSYINDPKATYGVGAIIRTGKPEIIPHVDETFLKPFKKNERIFKIVNQIGLKSYMGVPLIIRRRVIGAITFSSISYSRIYKRDDLNFAIEVANRISLELENLKLFQEAQEEIRERKQIESILIYLSEVSRVLSSSLDYKTTLRSVAKLGVPAISDWCTVEMVKNNETLELLAIAHTNPRKIKWAREYRKSFPSTLSENNISSNVIKTKKAAFIPEITQEMLKDITEEQKDILKNIGGIASIMIVPIITNNEAVGLISYISSDHEHLYTKADLAMAEEVAARAALAIENSRLFTDAKRAIGLRDDFISIASHELRTPLTSLKIFNQALGKRMEKEKNRDTVRYFERMDHQIDRLTSLIKNLLDVSKIRKGSLEFKMSYIDINEVIGEVIENLAQTSQSHKIETEGFIDKKVYADPDRIGQVVINLITNAIKYSPASRVVKIRLSAERDVAVIGVQDFGIGIEREHQNKIFNRFYRVDDSAGKTYPGLGIGLFISYEIIKKHGGDMSVVSTKGAGSTFSFTLPYKPVKIDK